MSKFNHSAKWEQREQRRRERESLAGMKVDALEFGGLVCTFPKRDVESERRRAEIVILSLAARQLRGDFCSPAVTSADTATMSTDDIIDMADLMREKAKLRAEVMAGAFSGVLDEDKARGILSEEEFVKVRSMVMELQSIAIQIRITFGDNLPEVVTTVGIYPNGPSKTNGVSREDLPYHIWYNLNWRPGRALIVNGKIWYKGLGVTEEKLDSEVTEYSGLAYAVSTAPYH